MTPRFLLSHIMVEKAAEAHSASAHQRRPMGDTRMSRLRRLFLSDRYFYVTVRLYKKRELLGEEEFSRLAEAIQSARGAHQFLLTAWVFLPDHWHAILYPRHPVTISRLMEVIKVKSTRSINVHRNESGPLWQGRFFDHAIRRVERYHHFIDYIHLNPLRRGLVQKPEEWRWSSFPDYARSSHPLLSIDRVKLPSDPKARL